MLVAAPTLTLDAFSASVPGSAEGVLSPVQVGYAWLLPEYKLGGIEADRQSHWLSLFTQEPSIDYHTISCIPLLRGTSTWSGV